ncbi:SCO3242 family prenyltransferase [Streptomyces candidus]|uniref:4-hydroxybenzoate polyprenyltransferase n=1 Tax=Streptomyces candidus TaxID=67283 RepID=A0A7X0LPG8_9ACTN|nr:UbiA family prenyltransferase [Streptomyces candidus]MBB6435960.1 4-hydroxybenzoate polyprenyltransferase [Streptomyces candidus]GHH43138.1 hypothetical protein GCM10018773_28640 [Streptomyces candidus]
MTRPLSARVQPWLELLRVSALLTVPGDALAGAAALSRRPNRGTALALASSLCLYEAGMALNDWADRAEDAQDRPHRPIPSGRIAPHAALAAACALSASGLALASRAGRPTLAAATALTATVWAYDLKLKHTALAPAAMATARSLDLLMGATATATATAAARGTGSAPASTARSMRSGARSGFAGFAAPSCSEPAVVPGAPLPGAVDALTAAALLGAHTYAVTQVSRHEAQGGSTAAPVSALAGVLALTAAVSRRSATSARRAPAAPGAVHGPKPVPHLDRVLPRVLAAAYLRTAARPLVHAALNPSPPLTQRAVGGGIRAMIPLQAALSARSGAPGTGAALLVLAPLARRLARKVSPT